LTGRKCHYNVLPDTVQDGLSRNQPATFNVFVYVPRRLAKLAPASEEQRIMTWDEIINSPYLRDLPFKIETNKFGQILMSPASNKHGIVQFDVGYVIRRRKKGGKIINECSIETSDGVRVADVAWASDEFITEYGDTTPYPKAPEICVEVVSPSNSKAEIEHKVELYLAKGAQEVWVVNNKQQVSIYSYSGKLKKSKLIPNFKL
jgi:Uma2 family endonuclease